MTAQQSAQSAFEARIRERLLTVALSPSHDFFHLDQVLSYALGLQATYGGDRDVITAAALLHDLGRSDPRQRGAASAAESARIASRLLEEVGVAPDKIAAVTRAIAEHDQPELRPSTLEGRILKDADFLAGFGAVGIARSAMWTGETGGSMRDLLDRLSRKMAERLASLEFEQSRLHAQTQYTFVRLFLDRLSPVPALPPLPPAPYIVIEGISGSGKTTQAELLGAAFERDGAKPIILHEPTPWYTHVRSALEPAQRDHTASTLLLLADRYLHVRRTIQQAATAGSPVISDRSYLSTMVYQGGDGWLSPANIAYLHTALPQPTQVFILDVDPSHALRRIEARSHRTGGARGEHETSEQLALHRERFLMLPTLLPFARVIQTDDRTAEEVHEQILRFT